VKVCGLSKDWAGPQALGLGLVTTAEAAEGVPLKEDIASLSTAFLAGNRSR
jgi:hypothetical protein